MWNRSGVSIHNLHREESEETRTDGLPGYDRLTSPLIIMCLFFPVMFAVL